MLISNLINDLKEEIKPVLMKLLGDTRKEGGNKLWKVMRYAVQSITIGIVFIYKS